MPDNDLLGSPQAAEFLGKHEQTLRNWRKAGVGPAWITIANRHLYSRSELEAWVEQQLGGGGEHDAS